ncbi:GbsR/MarR family transcriptional regulator [Neptunitalea lumnitzerae]|uniref:Transcriptional regulator n=1 Tax=Neptunitalea lumnitzerae TaxID=2965509 RepID=A0ABQ5MFY0_9FLAO|nr:MarR family transcriptional regulator [Neptunitalea sp. Y10]GLB48294.1 hypothetical protein Y10_06620 [Neptunitalea sp. Y10]
MTIEELEKEKRLLIEEMGVCFENWDTLSPLSSRIFALLALSLEDGVPFEEIQETLEASKSSISTNLQLLQSKGRIGYCTKPGDRKRYFKIDDQQVINRLDEKIEAWKQEKLLHEKVLRYKEKVLEVKEIELKDSLQLRLSYNKHYIEFIDKMLQNLELLKENLFATYLKREKESK